MSSSDQQYPYPYDPERQQPATPHWPDGTAGQSATPQDPAAFDQGGTQTWQAPTWDTQYQPTVRPDGEQHPPQGPGQGYGQGQGQDHGQPRQSGPYGTPQPDPYGRQQPGSYGQPQPGPYGQPQPGPYATPDPHTPYQQRYQEPQQHQPLYQEPQHHGQAQGQQQPHPQQPQQPNPQQHPHPQQPYGPSAAPAPSAPSAADTAYLPPQGASGSFPLPPEVPAAPATTP
ncbi:hypothetical protein G3I48_18415, partial [Streptomyces griseus]|nr:hypothetical protein [Streptomyces griseus]